MKDIIVQQCLDIFKRDDVKKEIKSILKPILKFVLCELNPYLYIITFALLLNFMMNLAILIILYFLLRKRI